MFLFKYFQFPILKQLKWFCLYTNSTKILRWTTCVEYVIKIDPSDVWCVNKFVPGRCYAIRFLDFDIFILKGMGSFIAHKIIIVNLCLDWIPQKNCW